MTLTRVRCPELGACTVRGETRSERDQVMVARALHVLSIAAWVDKDASQAVALIDQALDVVGGEPSAVRLRVLLWVNRANWSSTVDEVEKALHGARKLTGLGDGTQDLSVASAEPTYYYRSGRWP
ncbi:hypothetical protein OHA70_36370 [Kribbella sp. NBC_00382]|uniref:hypothetical protein n=1 Tax=Kribbella sp. NBC_00382 TaxID=2975967 RepID=UPI002E1B55EF